MLAAQGRPIRLRHKAALNIYLIDLLRERSETLNLMFWPLKLRGKPLEGIQGDCSSLSGVLRFAWKEPPHR